MTTATSIDDSATARDAVVLERVLAEAVGRELWEAVAIAVAPAGYAETEPRIAAIGCAFDGSESSRAALAWAAAAARAAGATLRLIGMDEPVEESITLDHLVVGGLSTAAVRAAHSPVVMIPGR